MIHNMIILQFLLGMTDKICWSKKMGSIHHARWMSGIIYILKMVIVGNDRYKMSSQKVEGLFQLAFFILYIYARYWFASPVAADAPYLTLMLWKDLNEWSVRDEALSSACKRKVDLHTWYLSPRHIPLALFSNLVSDETKKAIATTLLKYPKADFQIGKSELPKVYEDSTLQGFINNELWLFFDLTGTEPTFLRMDSVVCWKEDSSFQQINQMVSGLKVVNDAAERSVKFGSDYNEILTTNEQQRQSILQVVEKTRRTFPNTSKKTFSKNI